MLFNQEMLRKINVYEFLGSNQPIIKLFHGSCTSDSIICRAVLQLLFRFDKESLPVSIFTKKFPDDIYEVCSSFSIIIFYY